MINLKKIYKAKMTKLNDWEVWTCQGVLHRENNLPAVSSPDHQEYYKMGKLHRDDGAARLFRKDNEFILEWHQVNEITGKSVYMYSDKVSEEVFNQHWCK